MECRVTATGDEWQEVRDRARTLHPNPPLAKKQNRQKPQTMNCK